MHIYPIFSGWLKIDVCAQYLKGQRKIIYIKSVLRAMRERSQWSGEFEEKVVNNHKQHKSHHVRWTLKKNIEVFLHLGAKHILIKEDK